jgi:uncharacterized protein YdbL (DUF1318 family)
MATLKTILGGFAALALVSGGTLLATSAGNNVAYAQTASAKSTVDAAKTRGEIGEQIDGYLGIVEGASPSSTVVDAFREINIARKALYTDIASKDTSVGVADVAGLTGEKLVNNLPRGQWYRDSFKKWKQK